MKARMRTGIMIAVGVAVALLVAAVGYSLGATQQLATTPASVSGGTAEILAPGEYSVADQSEYGAPLSEESVKAAPTNRDESASSSGESADTLVIVSGSMELRVTDVESSLDSLRVSVTKAGGEITELRVSAGDSDIVPMPLEDNGTSAARGPASAIVTIRVPAEKVDTLRNDLSALGQVLSQTATASDVTEQAIDLEARMRNLRAEEARLRTFLAKTDKISDLLAVERELARVRGEIESMDAQLTYLERQAARATLTVLLSEPSAIVTPAADSWGLRDAITRGIQATAALLSTMITLAIPLAFIALIGLAVVLPVRRALRRRSAKRTASDSTDSNGDMLT